MNVFGVGLPEMMVIMAVALLIFGPKKLPEIGRTVAKTIRSLQDASKEFESELRREADQLAQAASETSALAAEPEEELADTPDDETEAETDVDAGIEPDAGIEAETEADAEQLEETVAAVSDESSLAEAEGEEAYDGNNASVPSPSVESEAPVAAGAETT
jgi:sec-independent protein translocase protein TatA